MSFRERKGEYFQKNRINLYNMVPEYSLTKFPKDSSIRKQFKFSNSIFAGFARPQRRKIRERTVRTVASDFSGEGRFRLGGWEDPTGLLSPMTALSCSRSEGGRERIGSFPHRNPHHHLASQDGRKNYLSFLSLSLSPLWCCPVCVTYWSGALRMSGS